MQHQRQAFRLPIERIAEQRVPDGLEMHSDLMGSSSKQFNANQREIPILPEYGKVGPSLPALIGAAGGVFFPVIGVTLEVCPDGSCFLFENTLGKGYVYLTCRSVLELLAQIPMALTIAGNHQNPAGILVQSMDDTRTQGKVEIHFIVFKRWGEILTVPEQQRIDQGMLMIACRWMHNHALFLVDDEHILVLVEHMQQNILCNNALKALLAVVHLDCIPFLDQATFFYRFAIEEKLGLFVG